MSVKSDIKTSINVLVALPLQLTAGLLTTTAKAAPLVLSGVANLPETAVALVQVPMAATKGYLVQEGVAEEEAQARAYRFVNQSLAVTITEGAEGCGALCSSLFDEEDDVDTVNTKK